MVTTEPALASARLLHLHFILAFAAHAQQRSYLIHAESISSIFSLILRAEPPSFVFLSEEEKRRLYLNRVKPLKSPQANF